MRSLLTLAVAGLALLTVSTVVAPAPASADVKVIGHRGYYAQVTENTLASFNRALRAGARGVELDVRITRNGRFVVMHDDSLARTTTCSGATVSGSSLGWIQKQCRGHRAGERIPSLAGAAGWLRRNPGVAAVVELKEGGWNPQKVRDVRKVLRSHKVARRVTLISGNAWLLGMMERTAPGLRTHALADDWADVQRLRRDFPQLDGVNLHAAHTTRARVTALRRAGWSVLGRNTSSTAEWRTFRAARVDGFVTPRVVAAARAGRR